MSMRIEYEPPVYACVCVRVRVWFCRFGACNMICEGNRKLLEWMRGKQCDMRQVGGRLLGEWGVE